MDRYRPTGNFEIAIGADNPDVELASLRAFKDRVQSAAMPTAFVLATEGSDAIIGGSVGILRVKADKQYRAGDAVLVNTQTMQIVQKVGKWYEPPGLTVEVVEVSGKRAIVRQGNEQRQVWLKHNMHVERGDMVLLDPGNWVAVKNLGKSDSPYTAEDTSIAWGDIGGNAEAKRALRDAIEVPAKHPKLYAAYGRKPPKGILLWGPPGTGKTLLGRAAATALAKTHGESATKGFFYVKGPELLDKFVGEAERKIRELFDTARRFHTDHGYKAIIFLDEAESMLSRRGISHMTAHLDQTIVPMFLSEMDGMDESGAMVILATNRSDQLDSAVVRPGRIDVKVKVGRPDEQAAKEIFAVHLEGIPGGNLALVEHGARCLHMRHPISKITFEDGSSEELQLQHLSSGALIAGICTRAIERAMDRDIEVHAQEPTGVTLADIAEAIDDQCKQHRGMGLPEAVAELAGNRHVVSVEDIR